MKSESLEMYIKAVYELDQQDGRARTKAIARRLGVKEPSVTEMLQRLKKKGFVEYEPYYGATLTSKGKRLAEDLIKKHSTLAKFLKVIGADEETAEEAACKIEHVVTSKTMEKVRKFLKFLNESPKNPPIWIEHYHHFLKTGKHPECEHEDDMGGQRQNLLNRR